MTKIDTVKSEVTAIISILSRPLTPEDVRMGWNDALRQRWHDWFVQIKNKLDTNVPFKRTDVNVAYGLGFAGIEQGTLANNAARVGSMLMEMASQP
jgi:hypothetical protein